MMDTTRGGHIITTETITGTEHTKEKVRQEIREIPIEDDGLITTIESNHVIRIQISNETLYRGSAETPDISLSWL